MLAFSKKSMVITASALAILSTSALIVPEPAHSFDIGKKLKKDFGNVGKQMKKTFSGGGGKKALQVMGLGLATYGILDNSPAAAIVGVVLAAAPEVLRQDMARKYGREMHWAGCVTCNKRRILASPDRKLSKKSRRQINARVKEDVKDMQGALKALGFYKKRIDGDFGRGTRAAVKTFQTSLGAVATGMLTAEQRHTLFVQADQAGYQRLTKLTKIDGLINKSVVPVVTTPKIAEYSLAQSQFAQFKQNFLDYGSQSAVQDAKLLPDGKIELQVKDPAKAQPVTLVGSINNISITPHQLSDKWVRIAYKGEEDAEAVILNTRDDLPTSQDARTWIGQANERAIILSKLVGDHKEPAPTQMADRAQEGVQQAGSELAGLTGFESVDAGEACHENLYVELRFPEGEAPISHYNMEGPEGVMVMSHGNNSANILGSCVRGSYKFSYVYVQKAKLKKDWKDVRREGSFQIAQNSEQCAIDLNNPNGSAQVSCF
ncbi:MAG: peptidoglycan-binding protein [Cohaesibacter sp.]|nr:peptidoglycan-binding protein [Cohaesibacter sp.]